MREARPVYNFLFQCIYVLVAWALRILYPMRILGRENLRGEAGKGYVLACNHLRAIDPLYVILARGLGKKMLIMGKDELFRINGLLNFFWRIVGCFRVERGTGDRGAVESAMAEVRGGRPLLIFPEGTRSKDGNLGRLKSGAFVVAMEAGADMIPCVIKYSAGKPKLFRRIGVAFGPPVSMEQLGLTGEYSARKLRDGKKQFTGILEKLIEDTRDKL